MHLSAPCDRGSVSCSRTLFKLEPRPCGRSLMNYICGDAIEQCVRNDNIRMQRECD